MKNYTLLICSDMQIDSAISDKSNDVMFNKIKSLYYDRGIRSKYNIPYELPHIVFWNLRSTTGFPCKFNNSNITMLW